MLRTLLGEKPRINEGKLKAAMDAMAHTLELFQRQMHVDHDPTHDYRKLYVWTQGLISSLDELEQSCFAAAHFRKKVVAGSTDDMTATEKASMHVMCISTKMALSAALPFWIKSAQY